MQLLTIERTVVNNRDRDGLAGWGHVRHPTGDAVGTWKNNTRRGDRSCGCGVGVGGWG